MFWCSGAKGHTVTTLTCVYSCLNITQNLKIILTSNKYFSSVNALYKRSLFIYSFVGFFLIFIFQSTVFILIFLGRYLNSAEEQRRTHAKSLPSALFFLVGVNFWAIIQAAVQVKRVQACFFCATCTPRLQWRKRSLQIIKHLAVPSSCIRL